MRLASFWMPLIEYAMAAFASAGPAGGPVDGTAAAHTIADEILARIETAQRRAGEEGHTPFMVRESTFALVAWLDERAMTANWPGAAAWRALPLQQRCFGTVHAGSAFYERLEALPEDAVQVREIYALMLLLGFRGRYTTRAPGEFSSLLGALLERVRRELGAAPFNACEPLFTGGAADRPLGRPGRRQACAGALLVGVPLFALVAMAAVYDALLWVSASGMMAVR